MGKAEELLNEITAEDSDEHVRVDADRFIHVPESLRRIAVQHDHNVRTVVFDCPRYCDGRDLLQLSVYVNWTLPDGTLKGALAENVRVDANDTCMMHFDWTITKNVSAQAGKLIVHLCAKSVDSDGNEVIHWNSERNEQMSVSKGMDCCTSEIQKDQDIVTQLVQWKTEAEETMKALKADVEMLTHALKPYLAETWEINENANVYDREAEYRLKFTSNQEHFNIIRISDASLWYVQVDENDEASWINDAYVLGVHGEAAYQYLTITIEAGQELPTDFVTWLNANATLKGYQLVFEDREDDGDTATIDGTWVFKDDITADTDITVECDFSCSDANGWSGDGTGIVVRTGEREPGWPFTEINYMYADLGTNDHNITVYNTDFGGWEGAYGDCKTITFNGEQTVSEAFMNFMNTNAVKM